MKICYSQQEAIGPSGTYFLFAGFAALAVAYVFALVPETRGRSPEEVRRHLKKQRAAIFGPCLNGNRGPGISLVLYQDGLHI